MLPPNWPVTTIASPGRAPLRSSGRAGVDLADERDADHQRSVPAIRVAAGNGHVDTARPKEQPS